MVHLSPESHVLNGGCYCKAITYSISVPALKARPLVVKPASHPITSPQAGEPERLPIISMDQCTTCRHIAGSILHAWFICPQSWISFSLLHRSTSDSALDGKQDRITPSETVEVLLPSKELLEKTYLSYYSSSVEIHRTFCGRCGTSLSYYCVDDENGNVARWGPYCDITLGTLDDESLKDVKPTRHVWWNEGIEWVKDLVKEGETSLKA